MKRCPRCGETKPLEDFHRCKSRGDGRHVYCSVCAIASVKATVSKDPEKYRNINRLARRKYYQRTVVAPRTKWAAIAAEAASE